MINPMDLTGKLILVTGASSGIGKETAILLSKLGARVILVARSEEKLNEAYSLLEGEGHTWYSLDLKQIEQIEVFIKKIVEENGRLDGFVHSAGISDTRPLKLLIPFKLHDLMSINFYSFIEIIRNISKKNHHNKRLSIIAISSISSIQGNQAKTAYSASKAAIDASIRCMAKELAPQKIRLNSVMPGLIMTDMFEKFMDRGLDSDDAKNILLRQYMGLGETIDVANMIAYLLSDTAKFITGSSISLDGGRLTS